MSIDFVCYSGRPVEEVALLVQAVREKNGDLFNRKFVIYPPRPARCIDEEIALDYGLDSQCVFLMALNEKEFASRIPEVVAIIKRQFRGGLIILQNNELLV